MTDIHVITRENRAYYSDLIEQHHRARHDIFVGERGWNDLRRDDCRDVDDYDDEHAIYLLAVDGSKLVGGQRLYPTLRPHMLSEVFPHLVHRALPTGPQIYEWTRYFVVKERRYGRTDCRLLAAVQQFCLNEDIVQLTAVVEMWWLPRWQQAGFKSRPLGLPQVIEGQPTLAVSIDISDASLAAVRRQGGLRRDDLVTHHLSQPTTGVRSYAA
ncbi:acyl-homoserine-lactone synthase [Methylobacterium iners]|uniref:Acyl-homoserine-lactone synthase n=1 Tax=Methylobacterium iners TaxID=418707 RepID=A0ABQ4S3T5_9HYPH|nr:acyl-homoserine-lactone synthase [Methylobacterium iners]GJD97790.1 Isovaleryl-homoserine lactone synthase [Methylobacterium iners]